MSTLSTNPRTLGLVEAWQDLEVRAREEEVKNWLHLSRARAREEVSSSPRTLGLVEDWQARVREEVSGNPRILGLVKAWQARAREEEEKNWWPLSRAREGVSASSSPRDSRESSNPSTIPRQTKGSIPSTSQASEAHSTQPKATLATVVLADLLAASLKPKPQEGLAQRLEVG